MLYIYVDWLQYETLSLHSFKKKYQNKFAIIMKFLYQQILTSPSQMLHRAVRVRLATSIQNDTLKE